jgi:hypothetical protein
MSSPIPRARGSTVRRAALVLSLFGFQVPLAAQEVVVSSGAAALRLENGRIFWSIGCGDEFSPLRSHVRTQPLGLGAAGMRTLYSPAECRGDRVASADLATHGSEVFWITAEGRVMATSAAAPEGFPARVVATGSRAAAGGSIALTREHVFWTEGARVMRARRAGGPVQTVETVWTAEPADRNHPRQLQGAADGRVFFLHGTRLRALLPWDAGRYVPVPFGDGVTAYHVQPDGNVVYAAGTGPYVVFSRTPEGGPRQLYRSTAAAVQVDALEAHGGTVFWHVRGRYDGGPVMRLPAGAAAPTALTSPVFSDPGTLHSDGLSVVWASGGRVYRLRVDTSR